MGMSMKLKKSTVEDVKARFEFLKEKKKQEKKEYSLSERLEDAKEEEEKMQAYTQQVSKKNFCLFQKCELSKIRAGIQIDAACGP